MNHFKTLARFAACVGMATGIGSISLRAEDRPQLAEQPSSSDLRRIERGLYEQGYHRISHLRLESGFMTARALDEEKRPVFLSVSPETGSVVDAISLK